MRQKAKEAFSYAFVRTIPIMVGYLFLGTAYGILMKVNGYGFLITIAISVLVYAGSLQYMGVKLLTSMANPVMAFAMSLMLNARHLFYGISMLGKYRAVEKFRPYLIFGLTDETFSIVCHEQVPPRLDKDWVYLWMTLLDHGYWVLGSIIGVIAGSFIRFDTKGLDFALTALFAVIFVDQWKQKEGHPYALLGIAASVLCIFLWGAGKFIIPAMILIFLSMAVQYMKSKEKGGSRHE